jgi:AraC family transcriptional regulator of adaptative response / DNA-3-methyladenine glycosylase II
MEVDAARWYRAFVSHDRRFDGRVFAGVVTTGIYCRPVCPVRPAKLENSRFFSCAAAAEAAGFRPCRRCRPEASPGTPAWLGTSAVVSRALRLVADGALDEGDVEALAERLGLGGRHLRRLFVRHLGASPALIARARRLHFARALIDQTELPLTQVALSAGFRSIRQFNHTVRRTFGEPPTALRRRRRGAPPKVGEVLLRLPYRAPYDWTGVIDFLAMHATPAVEAVHGDVYRRTVEVNGAAGTIEVRPGGDAPCLSLRVELPSHEGLLQVVERARRLFDLDAAPQEIDSQLGSSRLLRALVDRSPGLRVPGAWDGFELAVRAILGQQMTVRETTMLAGRIVRQWGEPAPVGGAGLTHLFPKPARLAGADLSGVGVPCAAAATVGALARAVANGDLVLDASHGLDDAVRRLCALSGLRASTAHYIAMRALGEPDAFPSADGALRAAAAGSAAPSAEALSRMAEAWRPWRAYAAMYLWTAARRPRGRKAERARTPGREVSPAR